MILSELNELIESTRKQMITSIYINGINSPITIKLSEQWDALIAKYQSQTYNK